MQKKRAITDLNAPNGSQDIQFQSQEFEQDGHRHFVGFQPHFHLNMTSQTQFFRPEVPFKTLEATLRKGKVIELHNNTGIALL